MMINVCGQHPHVTNLNLSWSDALDLPVRWRDRLANRLEEIRSKEVAAVRAARR
jgi:hypothetical protein